MGKNVGKIFEDNWKASIPENVLYYRPPDSAQGFDVGASSKLRFSQHSPCDCMLFDGEYFYTLEMKTVNTNHISFERTKEDKGIIHKYQFDSLLKFSKYPNVISGFVLDFRNSGNTYFVEINDVLNMIDKLYKKSFNEANLNNLCSPVPIIKRKLKVNYRYNVNLFLEQTQQIYEQKEKEICQK